MSIDDLSFYFQTATLKDGAKLVVASNSKSKSDSESSDNDDESADLKPKKKRLTDDEIFKACGGMTAHK